MSIFSEEKLRDMYASLQPRRTKFSDIKLFSRQWPEFFHVDQTGDDDLDVPLEPELYERGDRETPFAPCKHENMVVLRTPSRIVLLDRYDMYRFYASLVSSGRMPSHWKIMTIMADHVPSITEMFQLAMYVSLMKVDHAESGERHLVQYLLALQHVIESLGYPTRCNFADMYSKVLYLLRAIGDDYSHRDCKDLVKTAVILSRQPEYMDFLVHYKFDICQPESFVLSQSDMFTSVSDNSFTTLYWKTWWHRESIAVQILLTVVLMGFLGESIEIYVSKDLLRQVIKIVRKCVDMVSLTSQRLRCASVTTLLLSTYESTTDAPSIRSTFPQAACWEETLSVVLGLAVFNRIYSSVEPLVRTYQVDGHLPVDVIPVEAKLGQEEIHTLQGECLQDTHNTLFRARLISSRPLIRLPERLN